MSRCGTLAALLAGSLLCACGGSAPGGAAAAKQSAGEAKSEATFVAYARCLREHGLHAEVVSSPGEGHGLKLGSGEGEDAATAEAAERACTRYRPQPKEVDLSPQQKVEREEAVQRFAKCMREHGIEVKASAEGGAIKVGKAGGGGPNPRSPVFQQAQAACQKLLPGRGPHPGHEVGEPAPGAKGG